MNGLICLMYPRSGFAVSGAALLMLERLSTFIRQVHQGRSLSAHKSQGCSRCETSSEPYSGGHRVYHVSTTLSSTATVTSFGCGIGTASMLLMLLLSVHLPQSYSTHLLCGSLYSIVRHASRINSQSPSRRYCQCHVPSSGCAAHHQLWDWASSSS